MLVRYSVVGEVDMKWASCFECIIKLFSKGKNVFHLST